MTGGRFSVSTATRSWRSTRRTLSVPLLAPLLAMVYGRALLQERAHAFLGILGGENRRE
jgi:hypothetical protein